jgi:hypothetical protein
VGSVGEKIRPRRQKGNAWDNIAQIAGFAALADELRVLQVKKFTENFIYRMAKAVPPGRPPDDAMKDDAVQW